MKKQYMDFTPVAAPKKREPAVVKKPEVSKAEPRKEARGAMTFLTETKKSVKAENLNERFVKTEVKKRPLSTGKTEIKAIKAEKVGNKAKTEKKVEVVPEKKPENKAIYTPPKNPFINQKKIEKRPLSKTVYTKRPEIKEEEPKGPVTIITKPEKQNHVGVIVTVILTIILGAAAGTIAFLLLPK